jgi:ketosteroid isomerase-like protein
MSEAARIAEAFFDAWTSKDLTRARQLVHDDLSFEGPIDTFSDADSYLQSLQGLSQIITGIDKRKLFVDGDDVCIIYDMHTGPVPDSRIAEWYTVRDGRIASISVVFDARPFAPLFERREG